MEGGKEERGGEGAMEAGETVGEETAGREGEVIVEVVGNDLVITTSVNDPPQYRPMTLVSLRLTLWTSLR